MYVFDRPQSSDTHGNKSTQFIYIRLSLFPPFRVSFSIFLMWWYCVALLLFAFHQDWTLGKRARNFFRRSHFPISFNFFLFALERGFMAGAFNTFRLQRRESKREIRPIRPNWRQTRDAFQAKAKGLKYEAIVGRERGAIYVRVLPPTLFPPKLLFFPAKAGKLSPWALFLRSRGRKKISFSFFSLLNCGFSEYA